ncbi:MAG TPA: biotin-dependent carboxyltransferase family protein [Segeticoccus sp.]|nr:biotin-dependent carboxyltransferase family protein [Segeticoccus sp.]
MTTLDVLETGPLATVQDLGRPGHSGLGVGESGAMDRGALLLGNRLLGNDPGCAAVEVTLGGLVVRADGPVAVALTGAPCPATAAGTPVGANAPVALSAGAELRLGTPAGGVRTYLCVRGGVDVAPVLGSRSTDLLSGLGPEVLRAGAVLPVGTASGPWPGLDQAPVPAPTSDAVTLRVVPGPRDDWFVPDALATLTGSPYAATADSNRVGMRLEGAPLPRSREDELPSEGMVRGAVQVPPSGQPTIFLADHPVTGGYPVIAVVVTADLDRAGQVRPGRTVHFREASSPS